jgi:hypothetical protein
VGQQRNPGHRKLWRTAGRFRLPALALLAAWAGPALADQPAAPKTHHRGTIRAVPPALLAELGRYVELAPRCNVRDPLWAERLNMALNQAINEAGSDSIAAQRSLVEHQRMAAVELKDNGPTICRSLANPPATTELRQADALVK